MNTEKLQRPTKERPMLPMDEVFKTQIAAPSVAKTLQPPLSKSSTTMNSDHDTDKPAYWFF